MENVEIKESDIWSLYKVNLEKTTVLNIFTKAWNYRGGKSYSEEKVFTIIYWRAKVIIFNWKEDIENTYFAWKCVKIPANTPNIFYFPEDTEMLEWFSKDCRTEKFKRYGEMKKK